jgi:hypothetical protein
MRDLGNFGGYISPRAINNPGQVIGIAEDGVSSFPFIVANGVLARINALIDPALGWRIDAAFGINDRGQIVGSGCRGNLCGGVLLDPID